MAKTIVVCGHGPGISDAVAAKFGAEGFQVALVSRSAAKLEVAATTLGKSGVIAKAFPTDLGDPVAVRALIESVRADFGPITVLHWNAYVNLAGDLTTASIDELRSALDVGVTGLVAAVQASLPDLEKQAGAAVLVTGGGFAFYDAKVDAMAVQWNSMGLAVAKAAQHKLVGLLHEKLRARNIYVGEAIVLGGVKGTAFDTGHATLDPAMIASKFWDLYTARTERSIQIA